MAHVRPYQPSDEDAVVHIVSGSLSDLVFYPVTRLPIVAVFSFVKQPTQI